MSQATGELDSVLLGSMRPAPLRILGRALLVWGSLLTGCEDSRQERVATAPTVWDSAGVTILESLVPVWCGEPQIHLACRPRLVLGKLEGDPEETFGYVTDASRLSDGRILILDHMTAEVRIFRPDGEFEGLWGRRGEGPGEFTSVGAIYRLAGDSVVVLDRIKRSATLFGPNGTPLRRVQHPLPFLPPARHVPAQSCCIPIGAAADGSVIWRYPMVWSREGSGRRPSLTTVVRVSPDGAALDTLGVFEAGIAAPWPGPNDVVPITFTPYPSVVVSGEWVYEGNGSFLGYTVRDLTGQAVRIARALVPRTAVTPEYFAEWKERERERFGATRENTPELTRWILEKEHADSLPAYNRILVDALGFVWLSRWVEPALFSTTPRTFEVFDPEGVWLGSVQAETAFQAVEIGEDYILGLRRGELDEHYVVLYDLFRGGPLSGNAG